MSDRMSDRTRQPKQNPAQPPHHTHNQWCKHAPEGVVDADRLAQHLLVAVGVPQRQVRVKLCHAAVRARLDLEAVYVQHGARAAGEGGDCARRVDGCGDQKVLPLWHHRRALPAAKAAVGGAAQREQQRRVDADGAEAPGEALESVQLAALAEDLVSLGRQRRPQV
jgi:hypothetical protein